MIDIRQFDFKGDWSQFCRLYHAVYGRPVDQAYVNWKFLENPAGEALGYGAWDKDKLVGFTAIWPYRFIINGEISMACQGGDTMVHASYRGQGIFTKMALNLLEKMIQLDWLFRYSTPSKMSYPGYISKLGHRFIAELPYYVKVRPVFYIKYALGIMSRENVTTGFRMGYHSYRVRLEKEFDERFDLLWERTRNDHRINVVKTSAYLNWRYTKHPLHKHQILTVEDEGRLKGFAVIRGGNLLEMYGEVDTDAYKTLAKALRRIWRSQGQDMSHAWFLGDRLAVQALIKNNKWREWRHRCRPFGLYQPQPLIVYPNPGQKKAALALKAGNWRFTMGDIDCT